MAKKKCSGGQERHHGTSYISKKLQNGKIYVVLADKLYVITVLALPIGAPRKPWVSS
jgi:hypothetical protein